MLSPARPVLACLALVLFGVLPVFAEEPPKPKPKYADPSDPVFPFKQRNESFFRGESDQALLAIPPSRRALMEKAVRTFGESMDAEVHAELIRIAGRGLKILRDQKSFVRGNPLAVQVLGELNVPKTPKAYDTLTRLFANWTTSDISSRERMMKFELLSFTGETVTPMTQQFVRWNQAKRGEQRDLKWEYKVTKRTDETATVVTTVIFPADESEPDGFSYDSEEQMIKVEGQWVGKDDYEKMTRDIMQMIEWAKTFSIDDEKPAILKSLRQVDNALDGLEAAKTQAAFDEAVQSAMVDIPTAISPLATILAPKFEGSPFVPTGGDPEEAEAIEDEDFGIEE